jgi:hypothetical protein
MKKKYEVDLAAQYIVTIPDEQKVIDYYINGDWKDTFWELDDIEDLIKSIMYSFVREDTTHQKNKDDKYYACKSIEGFPEFIRDKENRDKYISHHEECGTIIVELESELEVDYVTEKEGE